MGKLIGVVGGLLIATSSASAGPAAWCNGVQTKPGDLSRLNSKDADEIVRAYVAVECNPTPEVEAHRGEIEPGRAAWGKKLGMTDADWADAAQWITVSSFDLKVEFSTKKLADMTPIDQWGVMTLVEDATNGLQNDFDAFYLADGFDAKLSEVGRMAVIKACITHHSDGSDNVLWAACAPDIAAWNLQKLADEIRADSAHKGAIKQKLRNAAFDLKIALKDHEQEVQKLMASDVAWAKVFELGAQARTEWAGIAAKNAEYLALAQELDSAKIAQSKSMYAGCDDKTYAALGKAVGDLKADSLAKMFDVRDDPFKGFAYKAMPVALKTPSVYIASVALVLCDQRKGMGGALGEALDVIPSLRGPRNYAVGKMNFSGLELDKVGEKISHATLKQPYSGRASGGYMRSIGVPIKSMTKKGDKINIQPAPLLVKREDCVKEHNTNHIDQIVNGSVRYQIQCDKTAIVTHNEAWSPFDMDAKYEKNMKVGQMISVSGDDLIAVWPSANATKPSWFLAGPIK